MSLFLQQFTTLFIKNWMHLKSYPLMVSLMVFLPLYIAVLFRILYHIDELRVNEEITFHPFDPFSGLQKVQHLYNLVYYSPRMNNDLEYIFGNYSESLNLKLRYTSFEDRAALYHETSTADIHKHLCSILFPDSLSDARTFPHELNIYIGFPPILRRLKAQDVEYKTWSTTSTVRTVHDDCNVINKNDLYTGLPGYYSEGMLGVLDLLWNGIMSTLEHRNGSKLTVQMRGFSQPKGLVKTYHEHAYGRMSYLIGVAFLMSSLILVKCISDEQETRIYIFLRILGTHPKAIFLSWILLGLAFNLIIITILLLGMFVPFSHGYGNSEALFPNTSISLMFIMLFLYSTSMTAACYPLSRVFYDARLSVALFICYYGLSLIPYMLLVDAKAYNAGSAYFFALFLPNTAMGLFVDLLLVSEFNRKEITFSNMNENGVSTLGICFLIQVCTLLLIGFVLDYLYLGQYGLTLTKFKAGSRTTDTNIENNDNIQDIPDDETAIRVVDLNKNYGNKKVIKNMNFRVPRNKLTAIIGNNGVGKTTMVDLIVGMQPATSGVVFLDQVDIYEHPYKEKIGFCPQISILVQGLTVHQHIYYVCLLRGLTSRQAYADANKYIVHFKMQSMVHTKVRQLSHGLKRKLSIILAFCGNTRFVFLDEPGISLDPCGRLAMWNLFRYHKHNRTIVMTTYNVLEVENVADRLLILSAGSAKAGGSMPFLKSLVDVGYCMEIEKASSEVGSCNIICFVQSFIPEIEPTMDAGAYISFMLTNLDASVIKHISDEINRNKEVLRIVNYSIDECGLQEVFLRLTDNGTMQPKPVLMNIKNYKKRKDSKWLSVIRSQFYRQFLMYKHYKLHTAILILSPMFTMTMFLMGYIFKQNTQAVILLDANLYREPIVYLTDDDSLIGVIKRNEMMKFLSANKIRFNKVPTIQEDLFFHSSKANPKDHVIFAVDYKAGDDVIFFSTRVYHASAVALNMYYNARIWSEKRPYKVHFYNAPLPIVSRRYINNLEARRFCEYLGTAVILSLCFMNCVYMFFYIKQKFTNLHQLQIVSGVSYWDYYFVTFIFDYTLYAVIWFVSLIPVAIIHYMYSETMDIVGLYCVLLIFGLSLFPSCFTWAIGYGHTKFIFNVALGLLYCAEINFFNSVANTSLPSYYSIPTIFLIFFPWYTFYLIIYQIYSANAVYSSCTALKSYCKTGQNYYPFNKIQQYYCEETVCREYTKCCAYREKYYVGQDDLDRTLLSMLVLNGFLQLILLVARQEGLFKLIHRNQTYSDPKSEDPNVIEEKERVRSYRYIYLKNPLLVFCNLTKYFGRNRVVNGLCLELKTQECIGILGANGAGAGSTIRMITNELNSSDGTVFIDSLNARMDSDIYEHYAYVPIIKYHLINFTVRELIINVLMIRGFYRQDYDNIVNALAESFHYSDYIHSPLPNLSRGYFRRVICSLIYIPDLPLMIFDHPTLGMDINTKLVTWEILLQLRNSGQTIIFRTYDIKECNVLCTRVAIMINGNFKCLASPREMKETYLTGFYLSISTRGFDQDRIEGFIMSYFEDVALTTIARNNLVFRVVQCTCSFADIQGILKTAQLQNIFQTYEIINPSLEHMFFDMCKKQKL